MPRDRDEHHHWREPDGLAEHPGHDENSSFRGRYTVRVRSSPRPQHETSPLNHSGAGQRGESAAGLLSTGGVTVERVISDNAKAYHSHAWRDTCAELAIARRYTRPYSPWTNGKAEARIKTLLRE